MILIKSHIIDAIAETNGFSRNKSHVTIEILLELIKQSLESGDDVLISGFGKFCMKKKHERRGRNPVHRRRGHGPGAKEGRHIPVFGDTEGETEPKVGNGKKRLAER